MFSSKSHFEPSDFKIIRWFAIATNSHVISTSLCVTLIKTVHIIFTPCTYLQYYNLCTYLYRQQANIASDLKNAVVRIPQVITVPHFV